MKRLISLYTFLLIALVCRAEYVQIDGIQYNMNAETQQAGVIRFSNGDSDIVIPEKVTHNGEEYPVTSIGNYAFSFCSNLTKFYCYAKEVPFANSERTFDEYPITSATLYVPANAIEAYKATAPWSGFGTIVALTDEEITQAIDSAKAPSIRIEAHDGNIVAQGAKQAPSFPYIRQTARK